MNDISIGCCAGFMKTFIYINGFHFGISKQPAAIKMKCNDFVGE